LLNDALEHAANSGLITQADLEQVKIDVEPPAVSTRDGLKDAQIRQIDMSLGILSPQTATAQIGQDYDQEQTNIELHAEKSGAMPFGLPTLTQNAPINPDGQDELSQQPAGFAG
jgi:hypothetical protein